MRARWRCSPDGMSGLPASHQEDSSRVDCANIVPGEIWRMQKGLGPLDSRCTVIRSRHPPCRRLASFLKNTSCSCRRESSIHCISYGTSQLIRRAVLRLFMPGHRLLLWAVQWMLYEVVPIGKINNSRWCFADPKFTVRQPGLVERPVNYCPDSSSYAWPHGSKFGFVELQRWHKEGAWQKQSRNRSAPKFIYTNFNVMAFRNRLWIRTCDISSLAKTELWRVELVSPCRSSLTRFM
jgi:hypothetical protein